jgi:hypothetical protein
VRLSLILLSACCLGAQSLPLGGIPVGGGGSSIVMASSVNGGCATVVGPLTISASFAGGHPASGSTVIASVGVFNPLAVTRAVTDNQTGNTYTEVATPGAGGNNSGSSMFAAHNVNVSGTFTVTFTVGAADFVCLNIYEVTGLPVKATDQSGTGVSSASVSSSTVTASGATTAANEFVFVNVATTTSQTPSAGTIGGITATLGEHTDGTTNVINLADEYLVVSSTATFTGTVNFSPNAIDGYSSMIGTFK